MVFAIYWHESATGVQFGYSTISLYELFVKKIHKEKKKNILKALIYKSEIRIIIEPNKLSGLIG